MLQSRDCKGRIYINKQGINAQLSGNGNDAVEYAEFVTSDKRFTDCKWSVFPVAEHQFPRLSLRFKPNLVSFEGGTQHLPLTDPAQRATKICEPILCAHSFAIVQCKCMRKNATRARVPESTIPPQLHTWEVANKGWEDTRGGQRF